MTSANGLPTIMTYTGRTIDFLNPEPAEISIEDIAHGLALECRFARQCRTHYSVAQHSVLVAGMMEKSELWGDGLLTSKETIKMALLHDAAEAYLGDVPRPLKKLLPDYREIEERIHAAISERFNLALPYVPKSVKDFDAAILGAEGKALMPAGWDDFSGFPDGGVEIVPIPAMAAKELFLLKFELLFGKDA